MRGKKKSEKSPLPWRLNSNGESIAQYSNRYYLIERVAAWEGEYQVKAVITLPSIKINIRCNRSLESEQEAKDIAERFEHLFADRLKQKYRRRANGVERLQ